ADDVRGLRDVRIARGESQRHVWRGRVRDRAVVRIEPEVLTGVADYTDPVGHGVEIKAERLAVQGRSECRAHRRRRAVGRIDRIKAVRGGQRVKLSVGRAEIDADDAFTLRQTGDEARAVYHTGLARIEIQ